MAEVIHLPAGVVQFGGVEFPFEMGEIQLPVSTGNRCGIGDDDCPYFREGRCTNPNEVCSNETLERTESVISENAGLSPISAEQSIGRSRRIRDPILHSVIKQGGIWEVFSDDLMHCGLSLEESRTANLVYFLNPNEKEFVFVLKNRYGPTRYVGLECLEDCRKMVLKRILDPFLGSCWLDVFNGEKI